MTAAATIVFSGGLDLVSPSVAKKPGHCIQLHNYEPNTLGTYQRILGYERFDGRPSPSEFVPAGSFNDDAAYDAAYIAGREERRALIGAVPGSGPIRGIAILKQQVYAFRNNEAGTEKRMYRATPTGWQLVTTPALAAGGRMDFRVAAFTGAANAEVLIGVDGVGLAWLFDGTTLSHITTTGVTGVYPHLCEVHPVSQTLFLGYPGGSLQFSGPGEPTKWLATDGAGELGLADELVGLDMQAGGALAVLCRNRSYLLYGAVKDEMQLQDFSRQTGAMPWTVQSLGEAVYLDDRGLTRLSRVQAFGNFDGATFSQAIKPLIDRYRYRAIASGVVREKNQYRLFFDDGSGLICTLAGADVVGFSTFSYERAVSFWVSAEISGREHCFFGADDGFVYRAEHGFSFDGEAYSSAMRPVFHPYGEPTQKKRFKKITMEIETAGVSSITIVPDFDYSSPEQPTHEAAEIVAIGGGGYWDEATWDASRWGTATVYTAELHISGVGRSFSVLLLSSSDREPPHIIHTMITEFVPLGRSR